MRGLPRQLIRRCKVILPQCAGFKEQDLLKALFVTNELALYQDGLPEAGNVRVRVVKVIDYLVREETRDGRSVFVFFLSELLELETSVGQRYKELQKLTNEIRRALSKKVIVPCVTVAMTSEEAKALSEESVFNELAAPIERTWFQELKQTWPPDKIAGLLAHYGERREAWKADRQDGQTIEQIVWEMTKQVHQSPEQHAPPIEPQFRSIDFFAEDEAYDTRLRAWHELSLGGVLIVDPLSLFHPLIYRRVLQSELGANQNVAIAIVRFSPFVSGQKQATQLIQREIKRRMQRAFARDKWDEEELCRQVESMDSLRRWLKHSALPKVVDLIIKQQQERPDPRLLSMMREKEPTVPQIGSGIFG